MPCATASCSRLGHGGAIHEPLTNWQLLGNGARCYSSALARFQSPDDLSPFGQGGFNSYAYCNLDPINREDPSGQSAVWIASGLAVSILGVFTIGAVAAYRTDKHKLASALAIVGAGLAVAAAVGGFVVGLARTTPLAQSPAMVRMGRSHPAASRARLAERFQPVESPSWGGIANQSLNRSPRIELRPSSLGARRAPGAAASQARARSQPPPSKPQLHARPQPQLSLNMKLARPARIPGSILRAEGEVAAVNKRVRFNDDLDVLRFDPDDDVSVWSSDA